MSKNKVTYGLRNVHVAFADTSGETLTWETPIAVPGAVSWSPSPEGESSNFFADDTIYFTTNANIGYTGSLEIANFPDEVITKMLGWETDSNGMIVETADAVPAKFALLGEVQGDVKNRKFIYYDVQANRPSKEQRTKEDTVEPNPDVLPVTVSPIMVNNKLIIKGDMELSETNATAFDAFFSSVYTPTFA